LVFSKSTGIFLLKEHQTLKFRFLFNIFTIKASYFMTSNVLQLQQVVKAYGDHIILEIPQLTLDYGVYWLLGQNGAGKSTCLKVMAGLVPFNGEILLNQTINSRKQPVLYRQGISYAEAEPVYPGFLTGSDLLQLYTSTRGKSYEDIDGLAKQLGVNTFIHLPVSSYSSGMLKKLSLLLAFTGQPKVMLLDEPLITLDTQTVPVLYNMVETFHRQYGVTFCITSHQQVTANTISLQVKDKNIVPVI
jgi:ABC-2 type transport system ATP-binding protein